MLFLCLAILTVIGVMYLLQQWAPSHFEFKHTVNKSKVSFGESVEYKQVFINKKVLPLPWVTIETDFTKGIEFLKGTIVSHYMSNKQLLAGIVSTLWYEKVTRTYPVQCDNRGVFYFGPTKLIFGDVIGLSQANAITESRTVSVVVYPRVLDVKTNNRNSLSLSGKKERQNFIFQDPYSFVGTRDYLPGDSPKLVNWKVSARLNKLQVNTYFAATSPKVAIFLNINASQCSWCPESTDVLELAVMTAAAVCNKAIQEGSEVLLAGNFRVMTEEMDTDLTTVIPFGQGPEHLRVLLESLARLHPYGISGVEQIILKILPQIARESKLVLVTPYFDSTLARVLEKAKMNGIHLLLILVGDKHLNTPATPGIETYRAVGEGNWREMDALKLV